MNVYTFADNPVGATRSNPVARCGALVRGPGPHQNWGMPFRTRRHAARVRALLATLPLMTSGVAAQQMPSENGGRRMALLVGTDVYTAGPEWANLSSPVRDASTLAATLARDYAFDTTVIRNATQAQVVQALVDLKRRATRPDDRVLVFIASHGFFDEDLSQGYLVFRDSRPRPTDVARSSYMGLTGLLALHEGFTAGHVLLVIDACFAGTIDHDIRTGTDRGAATIGASRRAVDESIRRRSQFRSRTFLTSGGNEYVGDGGGPDGHSPFAGALLAALRTASAEALPLTFPDLLGRLDRAAITPLPRHGTFSGHVPGGAFVFVPVSFTAALAASSTAVLPERGATAEASTRGAAGASPAATDPASRAPRTAATPPATVDEVPGILSSTASRGVDALTSGCTDGEAGDCFAAGRRVLLAHGAARDDARARTLLERGCTLGDKAACAERDLLDARGREDPRRADSASGRLQQACDNSDAHACAALARFRIGGGGGGSAGELLVTLRRACATEWPAACAYAALASPGAGTSRPPAEVESLLSSGCRALDATACGFLARLYVERDRSATERDLAGRLADAACSLYDPVACNLRAEQYMFGLGVVVDHIRARTYAERSCSGRSGEGCYLLGRMAELGLGAQRDRGIASRLYQQACAAGVRADCSRPLTPRSEVDWWRAVP